MVAASRASVLAAMTVTVTTALTSTKGGEAPVTVMPAGSSSDSDESRLSLPSADDAVDESTASAARASSKAAGVVMSSVTAASMVLPDS